MRRNEVQVLGLDTDTYERVAEEATSLGAQLPRGTLELISREVVYRLRERHRRLSRAIRDVDDVKVEALSRALISDDHQEAARFVADLSESAALLETVYLGYLAGAAERLGEWWEEDKVTLVDVHVAAGRALSIMRSLERVPSQAPRGLTRHAVFSLVPGEQHSLGITMAAELCRRNGWQISVHSGVEHEKLIAAIEREDPDFVGLSASGPRAHRALARMIAALRVWKPTVFILAGGQLPDRFPQMVCELGANALAVDPLEALARMEAEIRDAERR